MLTEMLGKGGTLCSQAKTGEIRCPLIVRPTSEDVITGHLFRSLGYLNPRWWLPDLLNEALGAPRFRRQVYRRLRIELWQNQPCYPRELLPWDEGSTQVDAIITWENPPTTVLIEMKYLSGLSGTVSRDDGILRIPLGSTGPQHPGGPASLRLLPDGRWPLRPGHEGPHRPRRCPHPGPPARGAIPGSGPAPECHPPFGKVDRYSRNSLHRRTRLRRPRELAPTSMPVVQPARTTSNR